MAARDAMRLQSELPVLRSVMQEILMATIAFAALLIAALLFVSVVATPIR